MWKCRECAVVESSRSQLLKHYRLKHRHYSCSRRYPCPYLTCPVTFKTWNSLCAHLSRVHKTHTSQEQIPLSTFSCPVCACSDLASERDFFFCILIAIYGVMRLSSVYLLVVAFRQIYMQLISLTRTESIIHIQ